MPYRTFVDSTGADWQGWDIVPRLSGRRSIEETDRREKVVPIAFADRRGEDRRLTQVRRTMLRGSYALGWLCFDNGQEKRRLTPIPNDWTTCSEMVLQRYAVRAEPVAGAHRVFEITDEPLAEAG